MKRKTIYTTTALIAALMFGGQLVSNPTGAPEKASGGPNEGGATCAQGGCHFNSASSTSGVLTSDIPVAGYTPGATYNITVTTSGSGSKGFMVSAQNASGTLMGTMTAGTGSRKTFTNFITHSSAVSAATATWTFQWKAPAAGSGAVTFYGAFAITRNTTLTEQVTVQENMATALMEVKGGQSLTVSPNPIVGETTLQYKLSEPGYVQIKLVSLDGKINSTLFSGNQTAGEQFQQLDLTVFPAGIYFMQVETPSGSAYQKVLVNN